MAGRSPSPDRLDDILVEDSYADLEQEPSPRATSEGGDKETNSMFQPATSGMEASSSQDADAEAAAAKSGPRRIPVGPLEDFKSAPKKQPAPQVGPASAAEGRSQQAGRGEQLQQQVPPQSQPQTQAGGTRYFLLKSVSIDNIERSVEEGIWATQKHNEEKLNKAFEMSDAVHLVFSVNGSGFFQGWARMTSRIMSGQRDRSEWRGRLAVGSSFEVEWQRRYDLVMRSCDHLLNPWNENKSVRIARDGQEMPATIGKQLVDAIEEAAERDHVIRPPKPKRRPSQEPVRRPPSGPPNGFRRPPGPMGMGPMPMVGMPQPYGMMHPPRGPIMPFRDFGGTGHLPPHRALAPSMGPMRVGPPQPPPPRAPRDSHRENGRGAEWALGPDLAGDSLNSFDDAAPFEDQAPRGRGLNGRGGPRSLLVDRREAASLDQFNGPSERPGQASATSRRMAPAGQEYSSLSRGKRDRSFSRSPSPRRRSRSRRRTRSRSDSRSPSTTRNDDRRLLDMTYEDYLANFKKAREKSEREALQRSQAQAPAPPAPVVPMNGMMGGYMPGMLPGMMGAPAMNPLMMSMMMGGGVMNPLMMGMNPMAGLGGAIPGMAPMVSMGMGGGMGSMPGDISEADYLRVWQQYSAMNNQPFNANHYRQMYRQFKGH